MKRERQKRNKIIIALTGILLLMTVGYAAFNTNLNITGTSNISNSWDVEITSISDPVLHGNAKHVSKEITNNNLSASMVADLYLIGDYAEYTVTIENKGSVDAVLDSITKEVKEENSAVEISFPGYAKGQRLSAGSDPLQVKVRIELIEQGQPETSGETEITFNFKQGEGYAGDASNPIPVTYLVEYDCTTNGGRNCTEYNEYLKEGDSVSLSNTPKSPTGKIFTGWNTTSNATTKIDSLQVEQSGIKLFAIYKDDAITIDTLTTKATSNKITVVAKASSLGSIAKYEFAIDDNEYEEGIIDTENKNSTFVFDDNLTENTSYEISVRITSSTGKVETATRTVTTKTISEPTYSEENNVVTITYPSFTYDDGTTVTCGSGLTCTYTKDDGEVQTATSSTVQVTFTKKGNISATVAEGTNTASSTYSYVVKASLLSYDNTKTGLDCTGANANVQCAIDKLKEMLD